MLSFGGKRGLREALSVPDEPMELLVHGHPTSEAFKSFPKGLDGLRGLRSLSLDRHGFVEVPPLPSGLRSLAITHTPVRRLALGSLEELEVLELVDCPELDLEQVVAELPASVHTLVVGHQGLRRLPEGLGAHDLRTVRLVDAPELDLDQSLPILAAAGVTELSLLAGGDIPASIADLPLERLDLDTYGARAMSWRGPRRHRLPESIGALHHLRELRADGVGLTELPEAIGALRALVHLDLRDNQLTVLPGSFGRLQALEHLDVHGNPLTRWPESVLGLGSLRTLILSCTGLRELPAELAGLTELRHLSLRGCRELQDVERLYGLTLHKLEPPRKVSFHPERMRGLGEVDGRHRFEAVPPGLLRARFVPPVPRLSDAHTLEEATLTAGLSLHEDLERLARAPSLHTLTLTLAGTPGPALSGLVALRHLRLRGRADRLPSLEAMGELRTLRLEGLGLVEMPVLGAMSRLEVLDLGQNPLLRVSGDAFRGLGSLRALHCGVLACGLDDPLSDLVSLEKLSFVAEDGVPSLRRLACLEELWLQVPLDADDAFFAGLARHPTLRVLRLAGGAPARLGAFASLEVLSIAVGAKQLPRSLQGCERLHCVEFSRSMDASSRKQFVAELPGKGWKARTTKYGTTFRRPRPPVVLRSGVA